MGDNEVLAHALANTSSVALAGGYAIKRSSTFVNEYGRTDKEGNTMDGGDGDPHHLMAAFPMLWCYGKGGMETRRPISVPYNVHVRTAIEHHDRRFSQHFQFIFQAFGVLQKRQVCSAACLQVQKNDSIRNQEAFRSLTPKDLLIAGAEEIQKVPFSNPTVKALRGQLTALRSKVMGTDESRVKIRGQIKGMCVMKGPPSLWITINPSDTGDPIAQVFCGESIDLDSFVNTPGPNSEERSRNIAAGPYAAAKFFHFVILAILEELFGIAMYKKGVPVTQTDGVFGKVASYIGTVEAQGRGTLHLHIVVWLIGSRSETFRDRVRDYISANIKADVDGATEVDIKSIPHVNGVSYSRPCDPRLENYESVSKVTERQLVRRCSTINVLRKLVWW
jgi:Helitron helicase-like domain at N-terminus